MKVEKIRSLNPGTKIFTPEDPEFKKFGVAFPANRFDKLCQLIDQYTEIPREGNIYVADDVRLYDEDEYNYISTNLYGEMPIQIGYCNGVTHALNGFEYHQCNELILPVTDCILMLAQQSDIEKNCIDSSKAVCFYMEANNAVSLFPTSLHYSPVAISNTGYKAGIILTKGTNSPLEHNNCQNPTLRSKNKWLIVHPDAPAAQNGAYIGVTGKNIVLNIIQD